MPTRIFDHEAECPAGCNPPVPEKCKFQVEITWNEVEDSGWIYCADLEFNMKPEVATPTCEVAEFGWGTGSIDLTPKGGAQFSVDASNVLDQQLFANDPTTGSPTGPGGTDVDYRDGSNTHIVDNTSGEPFRISYSAGLLEKVSIHIQHKVYCNCPGEINEEQFPVDFDFNKRAATVPTPTPTPITPAPAPSWWDRFTNWLGNLFD